MSKALVTIFCRLPSGRVEANQMRQAEADRAVARWPAVWSFDRHKFAPAPRNTERGEPCDPPNWSRTCA
jgi:hypothetical protein